MPRGFAAMDPELQREIASRGGKRAQELGHAHRFTREEAALAGKKGGIVNVTDSVRMSEIGKLGGKASAAAKRAARQQQETQEDSEG